MSLLVATRLSKAFGELRAVNGVDFTVAPGEVLALIGSNGAGKTSLVNLISGYLTPDSGSILFDGRDVTHRSVHARIEAGIARSFQLVNLFDALPVLDNVALPLFSRQGKTRRILALADRDREVRDEAMSVLGHFGLADKAGVPAAALSHGERKLLDVAVAYALGPRLLFLDEPTSGVSTSEKAPIMDRIASVVRSQGLSAVIIEHDMDVVFTYADRIVVMHQGGVLADGSAAEIREHPEVNAVLLGKSDHARR